MGVYYYSVFDTVAAVAPSWHESSVILQSSSPFDDSLSPLRTSMLPTESDASLLEEPLAQDFAQFIAV